MSEHHLDPRVASMIAVDVAGHHFQLRAAAVIVHGGLVLLHRVDDGDDYWFLPGGRVEAGEDARTALKREMLEELGERVECAGLLHVVENFFEHAGQPWHEIALHLRVRLPDGSRLLDTARTHAGVEGDRRLEFRWFDPAQLDGIDVRPSFLRQALASADHGVRHLVQRG